MLLKRRYLFYSVLFLIAASFVFGCSKKITDDKAAIQINDYTMSAREFKDTFLDESADSEDTAGNRGAFLENLIDRKLLLLEAERQGLSRQKDFLRSIQRFWEQSLLKLVIDNKFRTISKKMSAREQSAAMNEWLESLKKSARIKIDKKALEIE
jgi:hypothetical protein